MTKDHQSLNNEANNVNNSCCSHSACCDPQSPTIHTSPKVGRNDPCPCHSGRKFKKCCGMANGS